MDIPDSEKFQYLCTEVIMIENISEKATDRKHGTREVINLLLPDELMIVLAVIMLPTVLLPIFINLPNAMVIVFDFVDYAILGVFILEYVLKTVFAPDVLKHILNPWHLLDLFIVVVPLVSLLPVFSLRLGHTSLLLRLLRIIRIIAVSGRTVDRRIQSRSGEPEETKLQEPPLQIEVIDGNLDNVHRDLTVEKLSAFVSSPSQTWVKISSVGDEDLDKLSNILEIPRMFLESELNEDSYPRVDLYEKYLLIFIRTADLHRNRTALERIAIDRKGLLIICHGQKIITITRKHSEIFDELHGRVRKTLQGEPLLVAILYSILKHVLQLDKQIISSVEQELMALENIPLNKRPSNFLEITFHLRKVVNQIVPSLLHLREIISVITSKRVPLEGFNENHKKIFDILLDEAAYLHETASETRDDLQYLVDLYINTTSFETNRVMRIIAVITSLGIIPAVMGLMGSNIVGNPWNIQLWQLFGVLGFLMLALGWVFYRLGWLKM
jgi:Mg2+ and Co2+ transporter CorA